MPGKASHSEIEIKLRVSDIAAIRKRLKQIGARKIIPRTFESNSLYDTAQHDLRRRGRLLRIRIESPVRSLDGQSSKQGSAAILTYKAPSRSFRKIPPWSQESALRKHFKVRDEVEVTLLGAGQMPAILRALGLHPVFRYEKMRTTYALPKTHSLKIELDETPIGAFLELEGPVEGISRAASLLGYSKSEYMRDTYGALYLAECRRQGRKPGDMVFPRKKLR